MKRIIYALAALWPMAKMLKRTGSSPSKSAIHPAEREEASVLATVSNLQDAHRGRHVKGDFILCFLKHIAIKFANKCSFSDIYSLTKGNLRQDRNLLYALRSRNSYVIALTILFMCLIAALNAPAQTGAAANTDSIQPLQIGDKIPEELWHLPLQVVNHPEGKETITLNDYRGNRLIILEFWGSRCPPCIQAVDDLHLLYDEFGKDMAAIPVLTRSKLDEETIVFMQKRGWTLPSVVNDSILDRQVFSRYLPDWGDVWIFEGRLLTVPRRGYLNNVVVKEVLKGNPVTFVNRYNVPALDPTKRIFNLSASASEKRHVHPYIPHYELQRLQSYHKQDSIIIFGMNLRLEQLLFDAYRPEIHPLLDENNGVVWHISDTLYQRLFAPRTYSGIIEQLLEEERWREENQYSYELRGVGDLMSEYKNMQNDLEVFFANHLDLEMSIEYESRHKYAVLRLLNERLDTERLLSVSSNERKVHNTDSLWKYDNFPMGHLIMHLEGTLRNSESLSLTISDLLDSTGIDEDFPVSFSYPKYIRDSGDFDAALNVLANYGLTITIEDKLVPVLVVRQRQELGHQVTIE